MLKGQQLLVPIVVALALCRASTATAASYPAGAGGAKAKNGKRAPGEEIFDNKTVLPIRIVVSPTELAA
jgi:hypothetical protein